jgi:Histidine kinase-, DNA gyrase B-, and HSP90-like ATPase
LVSNAIKYTQPGGRVLVGCRHTDQRIRIDVYDTGIGITGDQMPRMFEAFKRAADRLRLRVDLDLTDRQRCKDWLLQDRRPIQRKVSSELSFVPTTVYVVTPGSGFGHGSLIPVHRFLEARIGEPSPSTSLMTR